MRRYWASRPDRNNPGYFWRELREGRLRQGWGYVPEQDLRTVDATPNSERSDEMHQTHRQRFMLGGSGGWQVGDIVIVPTLPEQGCFAVAEITGDYDYRIDEEHGDYGHFRPARLLTPNGVRNSSTLVDAGIRSTLRTVSRTWNIDYLAEEIEQLIEHRDDPRIGLVSSDEQRAGEAFSAAIGVATAALRDDFRRNLHKKLRAAEWERVIASAARVSFPTAEVRRTGGPNEAGADIEIEIPNPFGGASWLVVVQVKDYSGEVGPEVVGQLRQAIETRRAAAEESAMKRHIVSAVLAVTDAVPSAALTDAIAVLETESGVPVTVVHGEDLMELILRGAFHQSTLPEA